LTVHLEASSVDLLQPTDIGVGVAETKTVSIEVFQAGKLPSDRAA